MRFKHLLIRDVAYDGIPKDVRADYHERFDRHMEDYLGDRWGEFIEILSHHAERAFVLSRETRLGGPPLARRAKRALHLSLARAEAALRREDVRVLEASLALGRLATEVGPADGATLLRLELLEAENLRLAARFAEALASARAVATKAAKTGNQSAAAAALLCAARIELIVGDPELALTEAAEAARLYRLSGDASGEIDAEWPQVMWRLGNFWGCDTLQEGVSLADRAAKAGAEGRAADILTAVAIMSVNQGHPELAERAMGDITALGANLGLLSHYRLDVCRSNLAILHGNLEKAEVILRHSLVVMEEIDGFSEALGVRRMLAELLLMMGRYADAEAVFEGALRDSEKMGDRWHRAELLARRAMTSIHREDFEAAERYAQDAIVAARPNDPAAESGASYAMGQLRHAQGRFTEAEAFYRRSLETLRQWGFTSGTAETYVGVARFFAQQGNMTEATSLLDKAQAWLKNAGYNALA
jgi:tetratricopeptide (TPR) repeat protein